jgi:hypothetical protein
VRQSKIYKDLSSGYWLKPLRQLRIAAMTRIGGLSRFSISAVAVAYFLIASAAQSGQQIPGLFGLFDGLISTAIVEAARRDWQARPFSDYNCLARHGLSAEQLANQGIGPEDPRARQLLAACAFAAPAPAVPEPAAPALAAPAPAVPAPAVPALAVPAATEPVLAAPVPVSPPPAKEIIAAPPNPNFVVNGLALGAPLGPPPDGAAGYACRASDDYPGFAWCQWRHSESNKYGPDTVWMSVFRSRTNATVEITEAVDPAFFRQGDAEHEIQRLSRQFGQQARVTGVDLPAGGRAIIAAWGAVTLTPLDSPTLDALRQGAPVHSGLIIGALGDPRASARMGVPVYGLGGGAGFIWSANYNNSGKGLLRVTAVDPSAVNPAAQPPQPVVAASSPATASPVGSAPASASAPTMDADRGGGADQSAKAVVAAIQPTVSADPPNTPASISAFASQTTEAKVEAPSAPLASQASPASRLGRRVALIVANGSYHDAPLTNPPIDAGIVEGSLKTIGFSVTVKKDLDLDGFEQAISEFAETTRGADVALFYFAGHGFSIAVGGRQENVLMATSANFSAKTPLALAGGGEQLEHIEQTIVGRARATLIFVDACRNVPSLASRGLESRGFAPMGADLEGAYVVLSTREGKTAEDGGGTQGSPFARAFASVLPTPGLRIEDAYSRMREQVKSETSGTQVPDNVRSDLPEGGVVLVENTIK